jgi:hypothetical protein
MMPAAIMAQAEVTDRNNTRRLAKVAERAASPAGLH